MVREVVERLRAKDQVLIDRVIDARSLQPVRDRARDENGGRRQSDEVLEDSSPNGLAAERVKQTAREGGDGGSLRTVPR